MPFSRSSSRVAACWPRRTARSSAEQYCNPPSPFLVVPGSSRLPLCQIHLAPLQGDDLAQPPADLICEERDGLGLKSPRRIPGSPAENPIVRSDCSTSRPRRGQFGSLYRHHGLRRGRRPGRTIVALDRTY